MYALIHSPLVGPLTWSLVAAEMRDRVLDPIVPVLEDSPASPDPFWKQHVDSVSRSFANIPPQAPIIWIAHSGAGPLLPVIRQAVPNPVHAYVFVDAGLPQDKATRLELMKSEDSDWAQEFQVYLEGGGRFPNWSSDDLREILPDDNLRTQMVAEIRPRGLDFFTEPIPVFQGWPDATCMYILFSPPYERAEAQARQMGWITDTLEAGHFHMLVDPSAVTDKIISAVNKVGR
jgi:hypothetical protein